MSTHDSRQCKDLLERLLDDLEQIETGWLPDGDGVTVPVMLWADKWLTKVKAHLGEPPR